jgi:glyceraldehyde-3-phosphate dehydrogenase/erythrose-4-phosphate dehydrogenase
MAESSRSGPKMTRVAINGFERIGRNVFRLPCLPRAALRRSPCSCIFDSQLIMSEESLVKVFGGYDNEWDNSCRLIDPVERLR